MSKKYTVSMLHQYYKKMYRRDYLNWYLSNTTQISENLLNVEISYLKPALLQTSLPLAKSIKKGNRS